MQKNDDKTLIAKRFRGYLPVVIDIETAGFNAQTDAMLEIGVATLSMDDNWKLQLKETYSFDIEPFEGANLEQSALDFTGIDPASPDRAAITEESALKDLFSIIRSEVKINGCKRAILVGHNANFDHQFLTAASNRCAIKRNPFHPFSTIDTAALSALIYGHTVLAQACRIAQIDYQNDLAHRAEYDASITAELFIKMVNKWLEVGGWEKTLQLQDKLANGPE